MFSCAQQTPRRGLIDKGSSTPLRCQKVVARGAVGKVGVFGQPQGGLWTQDWANAWLEAEWTEAKAWLENVNLVTQKFWYSGWVP